MNFLKRLFGSGAIPGSPTGSEPVERTKAKPSLDQLLKALQSKTPGTKAPAVISISMLDESVVDPLLKQVRMAKAQEDKRAAVEALGILGNQRAVEPLCEIIKGEQDAYVFGEIAKALRRLADERAVDVLIPSLEHFIALAPKNDPSDPYGFRNQDRSRVVFIHAVVVRKQLAETLGALRDPRAVSVLMKAVGDDDLFVPHVAAEALTELGEPGINALIAALKEKPKTDHMHFAVACALEKVGALSEPQLDSLIALLGDASVPDDTRSRVADVLGSSGNNRVVPLLIRTLGDHCSRVRLSAASALGKLGDLRAVQPVVSTLGDSDVGVKKSCCNALGMFGDIRSIEPLVNALSDTDEGVRVPAACALAGFHDARAFDLLVRCLRESKDEYQRGSAAEALAKLGDHRAIDPLVKLLADDKEYVRKNAVTALGKLGGLQTVETVAKCLNDSGLDVQLAVAESLAELGDFRGFDVMLTTLLTDNLEHRLLPAIRGLGRSRDPKAVVPLAVCLRGSSGKVRKATIAALTKCGTAATEALRPLLTDPRPLVRDGAQMVLDQIASQAADAQVSITSAPLPVNPAGLDEQPARATRQELGDVRL